MTKRAELEQVVLLEGRVMRVVGIGDGRAIRMRAVGEGKCPTCGQHRDVTLMEESSLFQNMVQPVKTIRQSRRRSHGRSATRG